MKLGDALYIFGPAVAIVLALVGAVIVAATQPIPEPQHYIITCLYGPSNPVYTAEAVGQPYVEAKTLHYRNTDLESVAFAMADETVCMWSKAGAR